MQGNASVYRWKSITAFWLYKGHIAATAVPPARTIDNGQSTHPHLIKWEVIG